MLNWPLAFVTVEREFAVLCWVTVTFAPAINAPAGSTTVPEIATLPPCANAQDTNVRIARRTPI
jgi:hypothetical protein